MASNLTGASGESAPSVRDDFKEKFNTQQEQVASFVATEIKKPAVKEEYKDPKTTEVEVPIDVALKDTILEEKTEIQHNSEKKQFGQNTVISNSGKLLHKSDGGKVTDNSESKNDKQNETQILGQNDAVENNHIGWYVWLIIALLGLATGAVLNYLNIIS